MIELKNGLHPDDDIDTQMEIFREKTKKEFLEFYEKYLPKLIYHNTKLVRDRVIAEDIAIESILKSLKKINDYNPEKAGYSTWLFTISKNECIQWLTKNNRNVSMDKFVDEEGTTIKDFLENKDDEISEMRELENLNRQKGLILKSKIKDLKYPYRKVIELRELENKSYRDITIDLRESSTLPLDKSFFKSNYDGQVLSLVDPEKKKDDELVKFYKITNIVSTDGNDVNFSVIERDKDGLISKIKLPKGDYNISGEVPFNMSTLKSQIRNGRILLKDMVKSEFDRLNNIHLY